MRRLSASLLVIAILAGWLLASESGLRALAGLLAGEGLQIEAPRGRLLGPLQFAKLRWQAADGSAVELADIELAWSPGRLLAGELRIERLAIGRLAIAPGPATPASPPPASLPLPLAVDLQRLTISELHYGALALASELAARFASDGRHHRLAGFSARSGALTLTGEASLDGAGELPLSARGELTGELEQHPIQLALSADGPLAALPVAVEARAGIRGSATATLTPFAASAFSRLHLALRELDPAAWHADWPAARIAVDADIAPDGEAIGGRFTLANARPGPLDRGRLPLAALAGELRWQADRAQLSKLRATLPAKATLTGQGDWQAGALNLELIAQGLDAAQLDSRLRSTRLAGAISLHLAGERRQFRLDLGEAHFRLRADAEQNADRLHLGQLELAADDARLNARGEVALSGDGEFTLAGELRRFDPARFLRSGLPAARINADFAATGRWRPELAGNASFKLADSRIADQPLAGEGRLRFADNRLLEALVQLAAGPNRLTAEGAFGRPGERLAVELAAPQLALFGLDGGVNGQLTVTGTLRQPQLAGALQAARLGLPGRFRLGDLALSAEIGSEPDAPLRLELTVGRLETPALPGLARSLTVHVAGSRREHRVDAAADLLDGNQLTLAAAGSQLDARWQGRLLEARLRSQEKARNFRLTAPAPLSLGREAWQLGPLALAGETLDWRTTLNAQAATNRLQLRGEAAGSRIGQISGELDAVLAGPYALDPQRPWRGLINGRIADLGWLGDAIGDGWQSGGQLDARLELAGTPARPLLGGRFHGERLVLRQSEQGLQLTNGTLDIDLADNHLRIERLAFDSLLQPLPRALQLAGERTPEDKAALAAIVARPGRLEIGGEILVDRDHPENAALDIRLDRVGAWQLPDQWLTLSGEARLSWRDGVLGVHGRVAADAGYWQLAASGTPRLSDDVIVRRRGDDKPAATLRPRLDLDLTTELGSRFLFAGAGLSSRLSGEVRLSARGRDLPRASGSIRTRGGRYEAYGQKLDIERGVLSFHGLPDNPALDVRAVRKGLAVEPGVQIGGTAQRPVVRLISDPDLPDPEKLAWLVLGHGPEQMGAGDAPLLLAAAGDLLGNDAGTLIGQLQKTFGFDELGIRQGQIGEAGGRQPTSRVAAGSHDTAASTGNQIFSVGKRLSSNALLSYEQTLGKAESVVKLTVTLSRNLSLVGRAGSDNALDAFYTVVFGREKRGR